MDYCTCVHFCFSLPLKKGKDPFRDNVKQFKMESEKIISEVKAKVGTTDFSDRTIEKAVELFPVAEGTEPDEAYFTKVADFVKGMQGQFNHDISLKAEALKKNFKANAEWVQALSDADKTALIGMLGVNPQTPPPPPPSDNEQVAELKRKLDELTEKINNADKNRKTEERKASIIGQLNELKQSDPYVFENAMSKLTIADGQTDEDLVRAAKDLFNAEYKKAHADAPLPRFGGGGGGGKTALDSKFERKMKQESGK